MARAESFAEEAASTKELLLAIEGLIALVNDAYPRLPLRDLAQGLEAYGSPLSAAHLEALELVDRLVVHRAETLSGGDQDVL